MYCEVRYLKTKAFKELSNEDKKTLQHEFDELRPAAYRAALKGEVRIKILVFVIEFV